MALDISVVTNAFDADTIIIAVLAIAGVLIMVAASLLAVLSILALLRGDDWVAAYLSKDYWKENGFDSAEDHQRYRWALADDDTDYYWRSKEYERDGK